MFRPVFALLLVLFVPSIVYPAPITISFSGSVLQVPADDPGGGIGFGTAITGTYTFDDGVSDAIADPSQGAYMAAGAGLGLSVQIGANSYSLLEFISINVSNDLFGTDQYGVFALGGSSFVSMLFEDFSASVFGSDALPVSAPPLAAFALRDFHLVDTAMGDVQIDGVIDTLDCVAGCSSNSVPVPGTLALLGTGLLLAWRLPRSSVCAA